MRRTIKVSDTALLGLAFAIGLIYGLSIFGFPFFFGYGEYWDYPVGDAITHRIGAMYFVHDEWRFPLFYVPKFAYPEGSNIIFSDSIPLFALVSKIIYKLTGYTAEYFGFFIVLCFPLLALFTAKAAKQIGIKDPFLVIATTLFALCCPALLVRYIHAGLMAHFILIWGIYLYFKMRDDPQNNSLFIQFCAAILVGMLIQSYLVVMIFPMMLAAQFQAVKDRRISLWFAALRLIIAIAIAIFFAWCFGVIGSKNALPTMLGFGFYSMNLLSPFLPPYDRLPHAMQQVINWDYKGFSVDGTGGQVEGFNYLGMGVLLLMLLQLIFFWRDVGKGINNNFFFCLMLAGLFLYSLSNKIYFGNTLILDIPLSENAAKIIGIFRTSGRMFWPFYYFIVISLVLTLERRFELHRARYLAVLFVGLQIADTQIFRYYVYSGVHQEFPQALTLAAWEPVVQRHKFLEQYPSESCGGGWSKNTYPELNTNLELLLIAAKKNMPTNSAYLSRPSSRDCDKETLESRNFDIKNDGLYIFTDPQTLAVLDDKKNFAAWCREFAIGITKGVACTKNWSFLHSEVIDATFRKISQFGHNTYDLGTKLNFAITGNGIPYLQDGWSETGSWGIWSFREKSTVKIPLSPEFKGQLQILLRAQAYVDKRRPTSKFKVLANGIEIGEVSTSFGELDRTYSFNVPTAALEKSNGQFELSFQWQDRAPDSHAQATKLIGFALFDLTLSKSN
jgi:hypothetical protein